LNAKERRLAVLTRPEAERRIIFFVAVLATLDLGSDSLAAALSPAGTALLKGIAAAGAAWIAVQSETYKLKRGRL